MQMSVETLAADRAIFSLLAISSTSLRSFSVALLLQRTRIRLSISEDPLTGPGYSAAIDVSTVFPFFEISAPATRIVFPFQRADIHCCTGSVLDPDAATVAMLG